MKTHEDLINKIRDLIGENETEKALELLAKEQLSELDKELILINSRYSKLAEEQRLGIVDESSAQIRTNKINLDILNLTERIGKEPIAPIIEERTETPSEEIVEKEIVKAKPKVSPKQTVKKTTSNKIPLIIGTLILLVIAVGAGTMFFKNKAKQAEAQEQQRIKDEERKAAAAKQAAIAKEKAVQDSIRRTKIKFGKIFEGGTIFYINEAEKNGLIMAHGDVTINEISWLDRPLEKAGAFYQQVLGGKKNTDLITKKFEGGTYPAKLCADYKYDGFEDWYLPSQKELDLMWDYKNKSDQDSNLKSPGFSQSYYWSSTEINDKDVYYRSFYNGRKYYLIKGNKAHVRPIRQFTF